MNALEHAYSFLTEARKVPSFACGDPRLADPGKPVYCDGRTKGGGWMIATIGTTHRDATCLEESNHEVLCDMLAAVDPEHTAWDTLHCSHWAVGHVTHIIVDPANEAVLRVIGEAGCALADYPILSEDHHSALEMEWHEEGACDEHCSFEHCRKCGDALQDHARGDNCMSC